MLHLLQKKINVAVLGSFKILFCISVILHFFLGCCFFFAYKTGADLHLLLIGSRNKDTIVRVLPLGAIKPRSGGATSRQQAGTLSKKEQSSAEQKAKKEKRTGKTQLAIDKSQPKNKKKVKNKKPNGSQGVTTQALPTEQISEPKVSNTQNVSIVAESASTGTAVDTPGGSSLGGDSIGPIGDENTLYVAQKEFDILQLQQHLQEAIEQVWTAPSGVDKALVCEVEVYVDEHGKIVDPVFIQRTGVHIYDSAVEDAVEQLVLPKSLWQRSIVIAFKP